MERLIIDGNRVYELDEACLRKKKSAPRPQTTADSENKKQKRRN